MLEQPWITLRNDFCFRRIETASGTRNFFDNGYPYHHWWPWRKCLKFRYCGSVAKTTTLEPRAGNMPMREDGITPAEFIPRCIYMKPFSGHGLNVVGLSGPGAANLLDRNIWQRMRGDAGWLSFMSLEETRQGRLDQLREFVLLLLRHSIRSWNKHWGLEINISCPNVDSHYGSDFVGEVCEMASIADMLGVPLRLKANALLDHAAAFRIFEHPSWDALTMGNTIPYGQLADRIPFESIFGKTSPLIRRGFSKAGGYSGPCLRPINCEWIAKARAFGFRKHIWGCGGIRRPSDIDDYVAVDADGVQIASMVMTAFRKVRATISYGNMADFSRSHYVVAPP